MTAPVTTATVPRDVLLDRLSGLLYDQADAIHPSDLQERLDAILGEMLAALSRRSVNDIPDDCGIVDSIEAAIFTMLLDGIEARGLAYPADIAGRIVRATLTA